MSILCLLIDKTTAKFGGSKERKARSTRSGNGTVNKFPTYSCHSVPKSFPWAGVRVLLGI